ncbi:tryptophan 2,3-dioxygenase family protein [Streptomyces sp. NPDC001985]|uniref:tryptophan 2,3-dioxygenase family protein n=1 Tax=Streptomyces sp. NPDC001985 TaxID=3154406 RepID=UPI00331DDB81
MPAGTYHGYLGLTQLLEARRPVLPDEASPRDRAAEAFFIVVHQSSELWLRQILTDLEGARESMAPPRMETELALEFLERVVSVHRLLNEHLTVLGLLPGASFAELRPRLGCASGAESRQFRDLDRVVGLDGGTGPLYDSFVAAVLGHGMTVEEVYRQGHTAGPLYRIAETLLEVGHLIWQWKVRHLDVVARTLGDLPGTGGSAGTRYLRERVGSVFPELTRARALALTGRESGPGARLDRQRAVPAEPR